LVEGSTGSAGVLTRSDFPPSIATRELRRCSHLQLKSSGRVVELGERLTGCRCCSRRRSISHMFAKEKTPRSEEHTTELKSIMRISYDAVSVKTNITTIH